MTLVTINNGPSTHIINDDISDNEQWLSPEIDNWLSSPEIDEPIVDLYDNHNGGVRNWTKEILIP